MSRPQPGKKSDQQKQTKLTFGGYTKKTPSQPLTIGVEHVKTKTFKIEPK